MEEKFIKKMIRNYFYQYNHDNDSIPLTEREYEQLYEAIIRRKELEKDKGDIHDIVNDVIYDYLTK
jgi:hypothetical protein